MMKPPCETRHAVPACFNSDEEFSGWLELDSIISKYNKKSATNYCIDCTPAYAEKMRAEGRCGHPEVKFVRIMGELIGVPYGDIKPHATQPRSPKRARIPDFCNGTQYAMEGDTAKARFVRLLRHPLPEGERDSGRADDESEQHQCTSGEDNRI